MRKIPKDETQFLFYEASTALTLLENEIREKHKTPSENIDIKEYELIDIPNDYIRSASYFRSQFSLQKITLSKCHADNIAYALMLNDLYGYFMHRFNVFGIVKTLLYKAAIANIHAIIEGILFSNCKMLNTFCKIGNTVCKKNRTCEFYLKSANKIKFTSLVDLYVDKIGLKLDSEFLKFLKCLRDNIHIQDVDFSEWKADGIYTYEQYLLAMNLLRQIKNDLPSKISDFQIKRELGCSYRNKT